MAKQTAHSSVKHPDRKIEKIGIERLLLDEENPRLGVSNGTPHLQKDLLKLLWNQMAVDEVAFSIAANRFFPEEPLSVIPKKNTDKFIVVEGNRRLAAVLLLRSEDLQSEIGAEVPKITASAKAELSELPAIKYADRRELWQFLGFRHINGPKPWDAYAKARYVADVFEKYHVPLKDIADSIGDRHTTVQRLYRGFKILQQAEERVGFSKEDAARGRFYFSHLYTATDQPEFQKFLGISSDAPLKTNPVPRAKLDELRELMLWLYGSRTSDTAPLVRTQNPDLNILREVISKPNALAALRRGYTLQRAGEISIGDKRRFREALTGAKEDMQQAKATVLTGYSGEADLLDTASAIVEIAVSVKSEMEGKTKKSARERSS